MIRSFRSRQLEALWTRGRTPRIDGRLHDRILRRLDLLDAAASPGDMSQPGFDFHALRGAPPRFTAHVNGPWCITFAWDGIDAVHVDFENYH